MGMSYLAIGLVASGRRAKRRMEWWASYGLAGLAVGVGILEASDMGAVWALIVLAYLVWEALIGDGPLAGRFIRGLNRSLVVAAFAILMAGPSLIGAFRPSSAEHATIQDARARVERWNWATQWSLPKKETAGLLVPGLFGFRMDTPGGGEYWGGIGRSPELDDWLDGGRKGPQPSFGFMRFTGGGNYLGVLVALVALWAALRALRKDDTLFTLPERKLIWFWSGLAIVCLLLAFGRFAPFYRFAYSLPCFSTFRNPAKFLNLLTLAVSLLFACGLKGLWRQYLAPGEADFPNLASRLRTWWSEGNRFDRRWAVGCGAAFGLSLLAWLIYWVSQGALGRYLETVGFPQNEAQKIAAFSVRQMGWFALFFLLGAGLLVLILSGAFAGPRASRAGLLLGLLLVADLGRANLPWIIHWDYQQKYAANDVIEFLRQKPYEHRVAGLPFSSTEQSSWLNELYRIEWAQHHFSYYNIQSLDIVQLPIMPEDLAAFENALSPQATNTLFRITRRWQLTNTRYLLGPASFLDQINSGLDHGEPRFRIARSFDIVLKTGVEKAARLEDFTAVFNPNGQYAIFEFTGALPRARLYSHWQVNTNGSATLEQLCSPAFDPERTVLVDRPLSADQTTENAGEAGDGGVEFVSYSSKEIILQTHAKSASVLLLNDRFDPQWSVAVDGKRATLLRCNYLMRGVQLPAGTHAVRFSFEIPFSLPFARLDVEPDTQAVSFVFHIPTGVPSYVTLSAYGVGLVLVVLLALSRRRRSLQL